MIRKRLLHGGAWTVFGRVVGIIAALAVNALLARLLTPEDMGVYFLTISVVSVAVLIAQAGLPSTVVRLVAESMGKGDGGRARMAIKLSVVFCGLFSLILAGVFYFGMGQWVAISVFESTPMEKTIWIAAFLIVVIALQGLIVEVFRGLHDMRFASLFGGVVPVFFVMTLGGVWLLQDHAELKDILLLLLGVWMFSFLIATATLSSRFSKISGGGAIGSKSLLKISAPMGITSLAIFAANQGDLWVVGAFFPEQQAAVYGAVLRFVVIITITHSLVIAVVQSTIAEMYGHGNIMRMQRLVQGAAFAACLPALVMLIVFMFFGDTMLEMLFGGFYKDGYWLLIIVSLGQFIGMLFGPADMVLMMTGYQGSLMKLMLVITGASFVFAIWLVTIYGLIGVAIAWSVGAIVHGMATWLLAKKKLKIKCHVSLLSMGDLKGVLQQIKSS